jgi:uncharacterized protein (DUF1697 family)
MPRFVVLLRGVNVGKGNRVPMAEFRQILDALGYSRVQTLLNSGNAVCSSAGRSSLKHSITITRAMQNSLGVSVPVVVKSSEDFEAAVAGNPFVPAEDEHSRFLVAFGQDALALQGLAVIAPLVLTAEHFSIGRHAAYLHCPNGISRSRAAEALLGRAGRSITTRNWATVLKLQQLMQAGAD